MRTLSLWSDPSPSPLGENGEKSVVWDAAFRVDGTLLVVASGRHLVVYNTADGKKLRSRIGHEKDIYSLTTSREGTFIASGGADKTVSVWTWELGQKYTFQHAASVQALAFNPITPNILATSSALDFAIWTMPSSTLKKIKVPARVCSLAWTSDGQILSLGLQNGTISLRDLGGVERASIKRSAPVWDLSWAPYKSSDGGGATVDTLTVACWDGTLSFYGTDGKPIMKERPSPGGDLTSVRTFFNQEYLLCGSSDGKTTLMTRDGIKLNTLTESKDWVWRAVQKPRSSAFVTVSNDGVVAMHNLSFSTVHGLYGDRYAIRESCTDVLVRHLLSEARVRIKCRDYVKKVAVYRNRLAVQLSDRIIIYETASVDSAPSSAGVGPQPPGSPWTATNSMERVRGPAELQAAAAGLAASGVNEFSSVSREAASTSTSSTMMYRLKARILSALECNLLVVTHWHVVLCQDKRLSMYNFAGVKEREWVLEAVIRYIKVVGGPHGGEGLLVGLKSGTVLHLFLNNPFPVPLVHHKHAIRCLDMSMSRSKLALVDEQSSLYVYDCASGQPVWSELNAASVAWNAEFEDQLCFSGGGMLSVKTGVFPLHTQKLPGYVVGFTGSKVFSLQASTTVAVEFPQSAALVAYTEAGEWESAYRVACLGVTPEDWKALGLACLGGLQLGVARAAFLRSQPIDTRYIELINHFEGILRGTEPGAATAPHLRDKHALSQRHALLAEVLAYRGCYSEAAKEHLAAGTVERALEMFMDLKLWKEARKFAEEVGSGRVDVSSLMLKQAQWCEDGGDVSAAATIYAGLGQAGRAVGLLGERGLWGPLMDLVRTLPSAPSNSYLLSDVAMLVSGGGGRGRSESVSSVDSVGEDTLTEAASAETSSGGADGGTGLSKDVRKALGDAGLFLTRAGFIPLAREAFGKLGDVRALVQLHIDAGQWGAAHKLAADTEASIRVEALREAAASGGGVSSALMEGGSGASLTSGIPSSGSSPIFTAKIQRSLAAARDLVSHVHISRGEALAGLDKFEEALRAYEAGGRPDLTARILVQLACSALEEGRFSDASLHYQRLSKEAWMTLEQLCRGGRGSGAGKQQQKDSPNKGASAVAVAAARYRRYSHYADLYAAYDIIHTATAMPFSTSPALTVFNAARYLLNAICGDVWGDKTAGVGGGGRGCITAGRLPHRLSLVKVLYAFAKHGLSLGAHTSCRKAVDMLTSGKLIIPPKWRDSVEVMAMTISSSASLSDPNEVMVTCPRCGIVQPTLASGVSLASITAVRPSDPPTTPLHLNPSGPPGGSPTTVAVSSSKRIMSSSGLPAPLDSNLATYMSPWISAVSGDACSSCCAPFARSKITYEVLPLVEIVPEPPINLSTALTLLAEEAPVLDGPSINQSNTTGGSQSLSFSNLLAPAGSAGSSGEASMRSLLNSSADKASEARAGGGAFAGERVPGVIPSGVVQVPAALLKALRPSDVTVIRAPLVLSAGGLVPQGGGSGSILQLCATGKLASSPAEETEAPPRLFFNTAASSVDIAASAACGRLFHMEDLELAVLTTGTCPFSRAPAYMVGI